MKVVDITRGLEGIKSHFYRIQSSRILEDDAPDVLDDAIAQVQRTKQRYDEIKRRSDNPRLKPEPWGYTIYPERPLRFKVSNAIKGLNPRVDLYCTLLWTEEEQPPIRQDIHLRVWSDSLDHIYREDWDAPRIFSNLQNEGRVVARCHFDLANSGQPGPTYHLQFGGEARQEELCWLLGIADLPRLTHPPVDLLLVTQLVAANFFWPQYGTFREEPEWRGVVRLTQRHLLKSYFEECLKVVEKGDVLLDHLWNNV
jgi:hypothetical protein